MPTSEAVELAAPLVGILVGGRARRMGGQPKGLLRAPGGTERIVPRLLRLCQEALPGARCVLLGGNSAYAELGVPLLDDAAPGAGPLAGLVSLLRAAQAEGRSEVMLLAGDLPRLTAELIERLRSAELPGLALAPMIDGRYQPLFARYGAASLPLAEAALASPDRSLQALLRRLNAVTFPLSLADHAALVDWDEPADISE